MALVGFAQLFFFILVIFQLKHFTPGSFHFLPGGGPSVCGGGGTRIFWGGQRWGLVFSPKRLSYTLPCSVVASSGLRHTPNV